MRLPLSWLKEYVEIKEPPQKLADDLLFSGTKVESIEKANDDIVFDFEITPNRPDCLSVIGIAREVAAIYDRRLAIPSHFSETTPARRKKSVSFSVTETKLCPAYSVGVIDSVKIGPSPDWLASKLEKSGVRAIDNIVDVTNYVMLETGQPMHAFDYDKISGKMRLRSSRKGERVTTLDSAERILPAGAIIIEDDEKLIDLAGLMGGKNSEVDKTTTTLVLHVPLYDPLSIRRASQYLGLRTEASNRFEKKLDPAAHRYAFERAVQLISLTTGGKLSSPIKSVGYPPQQRSVLVPISLIRKTLGISINRTQIEDILGRLEFATTKQSEDKEDALKVTIPSFRTDINEPVDLTEEVGRIYGYNKFPKTLPEGSPSATDHPQSNSERELRQILSNLGLKEIYSNSLTSAKMLEDLSFPSQNMLKVSNRLVIDYEYLRPTLLVGLITAASLNLENFEKSSLFEIGRVFEKKENGDPLSSQSKKISAIFVNYNFSEAKGVVETTFKDLNIKEVKFKRAADQAPFGKTSATIFLGNRLLGIVGEIEKRILEKFDIPTPTYGFELDLEVLQAYAKAPYYEPTPKFPVVKENISMYLPKTIYFSDIANGIKAAAGKNFYSLELLEDDIIKGQRSILIDIKYYDPNHTLKKEEIAKIRGQVLEKLKKIGAQPRTSPNF